MNALVQLLTRDVEIENEELWLVVIANLFIYLFIVQEVATDSKQKNVQKRGWKENKTSLAPSLLIRQPFCPVLTTPDITGITHLMFLK